MTTTADAAVDAEDDLRPKPAPISQWLTLSGRYSRAMLVNGELITSIIAPIIFTAGFYLPLKTIMGVQGIDYGQFIVPIIILQGMSFVATAAAIRSAMESVTGMSDRLRTMPIAALAPATGRLTASFLRALLTLAVSLICGYVIGFRFDSDPVNILLFLVFPVLVGMTLTLGADALGSLTRSPEATSQVLTLPLLLFGMLSTGYIPAENFPSWIQWFVRNQPVSHWCAAMRELSEGHGVGESFWISLYWIAGMLAVFSVVAVIANRRSR